jgi:tetratricopeptide (TPR) repeat protein
MAARFGEASDALGMAARSLDPELRYRALYNLGVLSMRGARSDSSGGAERADEAIRWFKQALLLTPQSRDAKWNLELLLRRRPPATPRQGQPQPRPEEGRDQEPRPSAGGLSQPEAEAILSSVEQNEASTRAGVVRRQRLRSSTSRKDW